MSSSIDKRRENTRIFYIPLTVRRYRFRFNNQPDALIIQIYSVIKLYMFRATSLPNHQEFSTVHSALVSFMQVFKTVSKHRQDGTSCLCLETVFKTCMKLINVEFTVENS